MYSWPIPHISSWLKIAHLKFRIELNGMHQDKFCVRAENESRRLICVQPNIYGPRELNFFVSMYGQDYKVK
jgi:hypothetical protein